jgi:ankyrin repeat protein
MRSVLFLTAFLAPCHCYAQTDHNLISRGDFYEDKKWEPSQFFKDKGIIRACQAIMANQDDDFFKEIESIDINTQGKDGMTLLLFSLHSQHKKFFQTLLRRKANPNTYITSHFNSQLCLPGLTVTHIVCKEFPSLVSELFTYEGNLNLICKCYGEYPLHYLITSDFDNQVNIRLALKLGADPNKSLGRSSLNEAILRNYDTVLDLLEYKADPLLLAPDDNASLLHRALQAKLSTPKLTGRNKLLLDQIIEKAIKLGDSYEDTLKEIDSKLLHERDGIKVLRNRLSEAKKKQAK